MDGYASAFAHFHASSLFTVGLTLQNPASLGTAIFAYLVAFPYAIGCLGGASPSRILSGLMLVLSWVSMGLSISSLAPQFPATSSPILGLLATGVLWFSMGYGSGSIVRSYLRNVGPAGCLFTLGISLTAVCLSQIISLLLFWGLSFIQAGKPLDTASMGIYGEFLVFGLLALMVFGWRLTAKGLRVALKQLLFAFTLLGVLSFLLLQFLGEILGDFLMKILWWAPNVGPPSEFAIFATLALTAYAAFPLYNPSDDLFGGVKVATNTIIDVLVGSDESSKNAPLKLVPFQYQSPGGWTTERTSQSSAEYTVVMRPPGPRLFRQRAWLSLSVYQYPEQRATDLEELKSIAQRNLLAAGARLVEDTIGARHGAVSYECLLKGPADVGYGSVVCFVIQSNLFVINWYSVMAETFRRYRSQVEDFIEGLRFDTPGDEREE